MENKESNKESNKEGLAWQQKLAILTLGVVLAVIGYNAGEVISETLTGN